MKQIKIVVAGSYGAGKTCFINTASEIETVSTEVDLKDQSGIKKTTTVAMDYGRLTLNDSTQLNLFGTPGQEYFDFMWETLARGMKGMVFVVDSSDVDSLGSARDMLHSFDSSIPLVIAANKQNYPDPVSIDDIRQHLQVKNNIPVIPCAAIEKESVLAVLDILTDSIDMELLSA